MPNLSGSSNEIRTRRSVANATLDPACAGYFVAPYAVCREFNIKATRWLALREVGAKPASWGFGTGNGKKPSGRGE